MPLPEDKLLCPQMTVLVNDNIMNGAIQPMIGNFNLPLGEILFDRNDDINREIEKLKICAESIENYAANKQDEIPDY